MYKKKLLVATDTYPPKIDGVTRFLKKTIPSLTEEYETTIIAPGFREEQEPIGKARLVCLKTSEKLKMAGYSSIRPSLKNLKKIKMLVKGSDIIFTQDLAAIGALSIYYGKKYKKPVITYVHQITWEQAVDVFSIPNSIKNILSKFIRKIVLHLYNKCSLLLLPYKKLASELVAKGVYSPMKVLHLGVDTERFIPPENKEKAKENINIPPDYKVIGYCGRLSNEKNLETLTEAYKEMKKTYKKIFLLIVGSGTEAEKSIFKDIPHMKITGFRKDVVPYYQAMDIFVMPSLTETTSLATLEAMSCSLTVVATKVGYIPDYIQDRVNGFFFPKRNSFALRKKLEVLIKNNLQRQEIGKLARNTIIKRFSWEKTRQSLKKTLERF
ncbi:glycosyltransferase [Candidatus Woesearchaeota archaeon]|nr:glycosyltransferase [Candidatus Woesearchaeota archaeon]